MLKYIVLDLWCEEHGEKKNPGAQLTSIQFNSIQKSKFSFFLCIKCVEFVRSHIWSVIESEKKTKESDEEIEMWREGEFKSKIGEIESMEWIMQSTQWIAVNSSYGMRFKQKETENIRRKLGMP